MTVISSEKEYHRNKKDKANPGSNEMMKNKSKRNPCAKQSEQ